VTATTTPLGGMRPSDTDPAGSTPATTPANHTQKRRRKAAGRSPAVTPYLFILPFFLLFIPFGAGSILLALGMSFVDWPLGEAPSWVGIDNFTKVLSDPIFGKSMSNTVVMLGGFLLVMMPLAIFIAVLLKQLQKRAVNAIQLLIFAPITMSLIAVALIFDLLYDDNIGLLNGLLEEVGLAPIGFLTDAHIAPWAIVALRIWRVVGYYAIILFAGLQSIPDDIHEAAAIDGAGAVKRFWYVTLPLLKPVILFVFVAASIASWELFAEPNVLTDGGPARSTFTAVMYIFQASFDEFSLGRGAAASVVLAAAIIGTTLLANRLLRSDDRA
jgi:ABC-type sugar transport system permease subunit